MKKILTLIIGLFLFCPANAETYLRVKPSVLESVVEEYFADEDTQIKVADKYNELLSKNNNQGLTADDMWAVCRAGGLKVRRDNDKQTCNNFVSALAVNTSVLYHVCGDDKNKSGIVARCIENVFDATSGDSNVQVTTRDAVKLSQAYAKKQFNDKIQCADVVRTSSNDDFIACKSSTTPNTYYEFRFSDAKEHKDNAILHGVEAGICAIHGMKYTKAGSTSTGSVSAGVVSNIISWPSSCKANNTSECAQVGKTAADFDYTMNWSAENGCAFESNIIRDANEIKNEYGNPPIDNWIFSGDKSQIQVYANTTLDDTIRAYVQQKIYPTPITKFECKSAHRRYMRTGFQDSEDVLTCFINGKQVDFVFDDITQTKTGLGKKKIAGSKQALSCIVAGGTYTGKECSFLTEQQCNDLKSSDISNCPECKTVYWDSIEEICVLPAAKTAADIKKFENGSIKIGGAVLVVAGTVVSGGSALAIVGTTMVVAGTTAEMISDAVIDSRAEEFIHTMNRCKSSGCAESFLRDNLQKISNLRINFDKPTLNAIDTEVARLVELLPDDSEFFVDLVSACGIDTSGESIADCPFNKNKAEPVQIIRYVGLGLQIVGNTILIVDGIVQLTKTSTIVQQRINDLKTNGWVRGTQNGQSGWIHGKTGKFQPTLQKGQIGWNPASRRFHGFSGPGTTSGSFVSGAAIQNTIKDTLIAGNLLKIGGGAANLANIATEEDVIPNLNRIPSNNPLNNITPTNPNAPSNPTQPTPVISLSGVDPVQPIVKPIPVLQPDPVQEPGQQIDTPNPSSNVTPYAVQDPRKTGLIATAAVLGAVGTGLLIGGLISNNSDDDSNHKNTGNVSELEQDLNKILENADSALGFVDGNMIKLVRLATATGAYAPILNINGKAVAVVNYRGYNLPFYVNSGSWAPLLGIGANGGWFNVYPVSGKTGIAYIDAIVDMLNAQLNPAVTAQFVKANHLGLAFPAPGADAYKIINSEFINGVVETYNGTFTPAEQTLYNNNYDKMKKLF